MPQRSAGPVLQRFLATVLGLLIGLCSVAAATLRQIAEEKRLIEELGLKEE